MQNFHVTFLASVREIIKLCSGDARVSSFSCFNSLSGTRSPHSRRFLSHSRHTTLGRTPLDERSARRRDQYVTTNNTHKRQDIHAPGGIQTSNPSKRATADPRLRPRGHRDLRKCKDMLLNNSSTWHDVRCQFWCNFPNYYLYHKNTYNFFWGIS
jgi:hypothetical protein